MIKIARFMASMCALIQNVNYYLVRRKILEFQFPWACKICRNLPPPRDVDPQHFNADPDTEISFHFNADPDPTFHFNADPGLDPHQSNQWSTALHGSILIF
jgi:hypothetical protein